MALGDKRDMAGLPLTLSPGVVHVLHTRPDRPPVTFSALSELLSEEERVRAARFVRDDDRRRHILGRGLLRLSLARILDVNSGDLSFRQTDHGKPYIEDGPSFNISHSGNTVLVALALDGQLGVDVEEVRLLGDLLRLARTSFAPDEVAVLTALPPEQRLRPFFRVWARKEAMLKALGSGLTALESISVSAEPGFMNALRRLDGAAETMATWTVQSIACDPAAEAAVAWNRPLRKLIRTDL